MYPPLDTSGSQKLSEDIRLRYSASSAVTNGLEECMEEAEHGQGTEVSAALEGAVLTILHEIGEDPRREVRALLKAPPPPYALSSLYGSSKVLPCMHTSERYGSLFIR